MTEHKTAYQREYYQKNKDRINEVNKAWGKLRWKDPEYRASRIAQTTAWRKANPARSRIHNFRADLKKKFGIDFLTYSALLITQTGRCACCDAQFEDGQYGVHVDHDHTDNKIRGLVCGRCNLMLGHSKDSTYRLRAGAAYLQRFQ